MEILSHDCYFLVLEKDKSPYDGDEHELNLLNRLEIVFLNHSLIVWLTLGLYSYYGSILFRNLIISDLIYIVLGLVFPNHITNKYFLA